MTAEEKLARIQRIVQQCEGRIERSRRMIKPERTDPNGVCLLDYIAESTVMYLAYRRIKRLLSR